VEAAILDGDGDHDGALQVAAATLLISRAIAYPFGAEDDDVLKLTGQNGYLAAFTVRREANSAFVAPLKIHRSQIYSEMSLEDYARNLNVFHEERLK
jgi:hypothetical protein